MASALDWLTEVLFEDEKRATWTAASNDERNRILQDAGLDGFNAEDISEAMQLLAEELPPAQAEAIAAAQEASTEAATDGISALDHFVTEIYPPQEQDQLDEFDSDQTIPDDFEAAAVDIESPTDEPVFNLEVDFPSDEPEQFVIEEDDPMDLDDFLDTNSSTAEAEASESPELDHPEEIDLGEDPGDF